MNADTILETERLTLRRFTDTDADAELVFELDSDPEVMRYIGPFTLSNAGEYRERIRDAWLPQYTHVGRGPLATFEKATGAFVGWFFVRPATECKFAKEAGWTRASDLELGYRLRRAAWGRGLATEASAMLIRLALADPEVTGVVSLAFVTNRASWRVMEKVGMTRVRDFPVPNSPNPFVTYAIRRDGSLSPGESHAR